MLLSVLKINSRAVLLLALAPCWCFTAAQAQLMPPNLAHLNSANGLSENRIRGIVQDAQGYVWLGTEASLNRYDGHDVQVYAPGPGEAPMPSVYVTALTIDPAQRLWFGTLQGLSRLDLQTQRREDFRHTALARQRIDSLSALPGGSVLVGTRESGLFQVDEGGRIVRMAPADGCTGPIAAILNRDPGHAWVAVDGAGLCLADIGDHSLRPLSPAGQEPLPRRIAALARGAGGSLWLGEHGGLVHLSGDSTMQRITLNPAEQTPRDVRALLLDRKQGLWVGTRTDGAYLINNRQISWHFRHVLGVPGSLADNEVIRFFKDREGVIWIAAGSGGVDQLYPRLAAFSHLAAVGLPYYAHLTNDNVWTLLLRGGFLWVGTRFGGLDRIDLEHDQVDHYPAGAATGLPSPFIRALAEDASGVLWAGAQGGGLARFDAAHNHFTALPINHGSAASIPGIDIFSILADADGSLWLGSNHGLCHFDPASETCRNYNHRPSDPDSLPDDDVRRLYRDRAGVLWLGFRNAGMAAFDGKRFRHFHNNPGEPASLSDNEPLAFREDAQGRFWVGTARGLNLFDRKSGTAQRFTHADGLPDDTIYAILPGAKGMLWLSTNHGLSRFDPAKRRFLNFGPDDGLPMTEFNVGANAIGPNGYLYFGGIHGVLGVSTRRIHVDDVAPLPVIDDINLHNSRLHLPWRQAVPREQTLVDPQGPVPLPWQTKILTVSFTGLHFQNPLAVRYQYRLLGLNDAWVDANNDERRATFIALPSGDYRFQMQAANGDGVWSAQPAELNFSIPPAPWRTAWAYAAYLLLFSLATYALLRARWQALLEKRQMQHRIAATKEQLQIALQASGGELFDWKLQDHRIHRINELPWAVQRPRDIDPEQIDSMSDRIHPADFETATGNIRAHLEGHSASVDTTYRLKTRDGQWHWVTTRARVVERDATGQALRVAGATMDVDQLKRAEAAVQDLNEHLEQRVTERTQELTQTLEELAEAKKMAALGNLVAGVAHEINTPLGIAVTATSYLEQELSQLQRALDEQRLKKSELDAFQERTAEGLALTSRNLERAAHLIRNFKQVAVDQTGEQARKFDLRDYLQQVCDAMKPQLRKGQYRLTLHCDKDIDCHSFPGALWQVISNLVMNSIIHGFGKAGKGEISIHVQADEQHVSLIYRDDGSGMDKTVRDKIFEPFFTTRRDTGGSGLGMHIVYNTVTSVLGGTIRCTSAPNQGAAFELSFPRECVTFTSLSPLEREEGTLTEPPPLAKED